MPQENKLSRLKTAYEKVALWIASNSETTTLDAGLKVAGYNFCVPGAFRKKRKPDCETIEKKAFELYETVVDELCGNEFRLSSSNFSDEEKSEIINKLSRSGFNIGINDFLDIIQIAREIRNSRFHSTPPKDSSQTQHRHSSLNCHDYDRLKIEIKELADSLGYECLEKECKTLCRIIREANEGEAAPYPGRHLPFNKLKGRSAWRYQCLRIMDEILCTSDHPLNSKEMAEMIRDKARQYRIFVQADEDTFDKDISEIRFSESVLKHHYSTLSDLINVGYSQGRKIKYSRAIFEPGRNGHLYRIYKGSQRLSAFAVDISVSEASALRKEIGILRVKYFNDDKELFADRFPLISLLGYMDDIVLESESSDKQLNKVPNSDLVTVNYKPDNLSALKKKVESAVSLHIPLAVKLARGWDIVLPVAVKEDRDKWALLATGYDDGRLRVFPSEALKSTFGTDASEGEENRAGLTTHIIGIGSPLRNEPLEVTLELTNAGTRNIESPDSAFQPLNPRIERRRIQSVNRFSEGNLAVFAVYLNEDFLNELFQLDKAAKLISVGPSVVNDLYESYFEKRMGKKRIPLQDRAASMKRLKEPRKR